MQSHHNTNNIGYGNNLTCCKEVSFINCKAKENLNPDSDTYDLKKINKNNRKIHVKGNNQMNNYGSLDYPVINFNGCKDREPKKYHPQ